MQRVFCKSPFIALLFGLLLGTMRVASAGVETFDWDDTDWPSNATDVDYGLGTVNLDFDITGTMPSGRPNDLTTYSASGGFGDGDSLILGRSSGTVTLQFQTSAAVTDLQFSLYDVDNSDSVTIRAFNGATEISLTGTEITQEDAANATYSVNTASQTGSVLTGGGTNSGGNSDNGTVNVDIAGPVTRVTVDGTTTGSTSFLFALSDVTLTADDPPASTCPGDLVRLDWDNQSYPAGSLSETFSVADVAPFPDVDFDFSYSGNTGDFVGSPNEVTTFTETAGGFIDSPTLNFLHDPSPDTTSPRVTITIDLSDSLQDVRFTLADIDAATPGDFIDQVTVLGSDNGTARTPVLEALSEGSTYSFPSATEIRAHGFSDNTENNARSSVNVYFEDPVDQIQLIYDDPGGDGGDRKVILSDILFCPPSSLPVTLSHLVSRRTSEGVEVSWQTATQTLHAGFELQLLDGNGSLVAAKRLPTSKSWSVKPRSYSVTLGDARHASQVMLISHDVTGRSESFGPFSIGSEQGSLMAHRGIAWADINREVAERLKLRGLKNTEHGLIRQKGSASAAYVEVDREGIYRVTHGDLLSAGIDLTGAAADRLAVSFRGRPVSRLVNMAGPGFGPGDSIDFHGSGPEGEDAIYLSAYRYRIDLDPARVRAGTVSIAVANGAEPTQYTATVRVENDRNYDFAMPNGDPFFDRQLLAFGSPVSTDVSLDLSHIVPGGTARIQLEMIGVNDWPGSPDHHLLAYLNGSAAPFVDARTDGLTSWPVNAVVSTDSLVEGSNTIRIEVPGDTGFDFDIVYLDAYGISYPRAFVAVDDQIRFDGSSAAYAIDGFSSGDLLAYGLTEAGDLVSLAVAAEPGSLGMLARLAGVGVDGDGLFGSGFEDDTNTADNSSPQQASYFVMTGSELLRPNLSAAGSGSLSVPAATDYLIITHPAFMGPDLSGYASARSGEGYSPRIVDVLEVYDAYSFGMALPQAITDFLSDAVATSAVDHVLLVGADSYDYRDFLGLGSVSYIPTRYAQTYGLINFTPSDGLLTDLDGDEVSDLAIGRWPVRTLGDLQATISKTLEFATSGLASARSALLVADIRADGVPPFGEQSDRIGGMLSNAGGLPWPTQDKVYRDDVALSPARQQIIDSVNAGRTLTVFSGHGSPDKWAFDGLLRIEEVSMFTNSGSPTLMMPLTCYTTYWVDPNVDTLAYTLMNSGDRGAVALHGAASLSGYGENETLGGIVIGQMINQGQTLGQAILQARQQLHQQNPSLYRSVIVNWALLGDPTLRIE
ncbi:MAG: C25 family cysteine peptidase [Xanthomonadales bacterium]|nr:C25 family cysteine peptidase [Xanthomonadales bacterium]